MTIVRAVQGNTARKMEGSVGSIQTSEKSWRQTVSKQKLLL